MPGTTARGFRIPLDTDPAADGALAVRNLAADVNDTVGRHAAGVATAVITSAAQGDVVVNFPAGRFTAAPNVVATSTATNYYATIFAGPTATQVTLRANHKDGTAATVNVGIQWHAVQV